MKTNTIVTAVGSVILMSCIVSSSPGQGTRYPVSEITPEPVFAMGLAYIGEGRFGDYDESALAEIDARWNAAYFRDIAGGDVDLALDFEVLLPQASAGIQLPDQLVALRLDAEWVWMDDFAKRAVRLNVMPGLYSDMEKTEGVYVPFSGVLEQGFGSRWRGSIGAEVRPGFDTAVVPLAGVVWAVSDRLNVDARWPEGRIVYRPGRKWSSHLGYRWQNRSYHLHEKGSFERGEVTYEDTRIFAGFIHRVLGQLEFLAEAGMALDRQIKFEKEVEELEKDMAVEDSFFLKFGISGPF